MATYIVASKADIAKSQSITQAVDDGLLPHPPAGTQKLNTCELLGCKTVLRRHVKGHGECCLDCAWAMDEWQEVLDLVDSDDVELELIDAGLLIGYQRPELCMQPKKQFAFDLLMETFVSWVELELETVIKGYSVDHLTRIAIETKGFNNAAHIYRAANGQCRSWMKQVDFTSIDMAWFSVSVWDWYQRCSYPIKLDDPDAKREPWVQPTITLEYSFALDWLSRIHRYVASKQLKNAPQNDKTAPISSAVSMRPVVLPQALLSKEDVLEAVAMSKVIPNPERLSELYEAVVFGVENYDNEDARIIFDGFYLERSESGTFIHLKHKDHPNRVTVGAADIVTGEMEFVAERADLRDFMAKIIAGMKPADNPKLPGVIVQAPIQDEDKRPSPRVNGENQYAEIARVDELPLFADPDNDPESAA